MVTLALIDEFGSVVVTTLGIILSDANISTISRLPEIR